MVVTLDKRTNNIDAKKITLQATEKNVLGPVQGKLQRE